MRVTLSKLRLFRRSVHEQKHRTAGRGQAHALGDRRGQGESKSGGNDFLTAISEDLGSGFEEHLEQTKGHVQRL